MGIIIPNNRIEIPQMVKLFSNPVSGIACEMDPKSNYNLAHGGYYHLRNIRYSKSMMLGALNFWFDRLHSYYLKVYKIRKIALIDISDHIVTYMVQLRDIMNMIETLPNSFLFSHRYIQTGSFKDYSDDTPCKLLKKKYPHIIKKDQPLWIQKGKRDIFYNIHLRDLGISFTVFPNEHPYIQRNKISKVGMTDKGNIYILHKKRCVKV